MKFQKGQSGNPGGRPKAATAFAKLALSKTRDGEELLDFLLDVMRGRMASMSDEKSRRWAASELLDRTLGRAPQFVEVTSGDGLARVDYSVLTDAELEQLEAITAKLQLAAQAPGDGGRVH